MNIKCILCVLLIVCAIFTACVQNSGHANENDFFAGNAEKFEVSEGEFKSELAHFLSENKLNDSSNPIVLVAKNGFSPNGTEKLCFQMYYEINKPKVDMGFSFKEFIVSISGYYDKNNVLLKPIVRSQNDSKMINKRMFSAELTSLEMFTPISFFEICNSDNKTSNKYIYFIYKNLGT